VAFCPMALVRGQTQRALPRRRRLARPQRPSSRRKRQAPNVVRRPPLAARTITRCTVGSPGTRPDHSHAGRLATTAHASYPDDLLRPRWPLWPAPRPVRGPAGHEPSVPRGGVLRPCPARPPAPLPGGGPHRKSSRQSPEDHRPGLSSQSSPGGAHLEPLLPGATTPPAGPAIPARRPPRPEHPVPPRSCPGRPVKAGAGVHAPRGL
jgi:hypothetical protein